MNRWHKLLEHWIDVEFRHSLTFAFILGALRLPVGSLTPKADAAREDLARLLEEIRDFEPVTHIFHVYRCHNLDKLVLSRVVGLAAPPGAMAVTPRLGHSPALYVSDVSLTGSTFGLEQLGEEIWRECGEAVASGQFSCRGTMFQKFSTEEVLMIGRALA